MSPLDVHVNRSPVAGTVELVRHTAGKFRAAFADKASLDNERNAVVLRAAGTALPRGADRRRARAPHRLPPAGRAIAWRAASASG